MKERGVDAARTLEFKPPVGSLALTHDEFATIAALAREQFGVELGEGKEQLVAARLGKLMRHLGFSTFRAYYDHLRADHTGEALVQLIDALTTNHTSFFREQTHFDFLLARIFPEWDDAGASASGAPRAQLVKSPTPSLSSRASTSERRARACPGFLLPTFPAAHSRRADGASIPPVVSRQFCHRG